MDVSKRVGLFAAVLCFAAVLGITFLQGAPEVKAADDSGVQAMDTVGGIGYRYYCYEGDSDGEGPYAVLKYVDMNGRTECDVPESLGGYPHSHPGSHTSSLDRLKDSRRSHACSSWSFSSSGPRP